MAFTEQNKADAYLFFVLAFNAAPGTVYGGQIVEAYESGMTTADIVAEYVTKDAFKAIYPDSQTNAEFAAALVNNVASANNPAAAKTAAIADIEKALADGWTKAQVITQIIGNLANKTVADAEWGVTVAQLNNKVAVAKVLTEGDKALATTDVALLTNPLAAVTEDPASVQKAINGAGSLADKLEVLNAANKAKADFAASLDLGADGTLDGLTSATVQAAVDADLIAKAPTITGWSATNTPAQNAAAVATAKANNDAAVATAQLAVTNQTKVITDLGVTAAQISQYKVLANNVKATTEASDAADAAQAGKLVELNTLTGGSSTVGTGGAVAGYITVDADGKLSLDTSGTTQVTDANKAVVTALLNSIVTAQTAATNETNALTAKAQFEIELDKANDNDTDGIEKSAIDSLITLEANVVTAQKANPALDKALAAYDAAKANDSKLVELDKAIATAKEAFTEAGLPVPVEVATALVATAGDDTFVIGAAPVGDIGGFGALGKDVIFVGSNYELNTTGDLSKGDAAKLEVFFKANGANTDVYVEQKAFASNVTGTPADIVKITLAGVAADKLAFEDGFITLA